MKKWCTDCKGDGPHLNAIDKTVTESMFKNFAPTWRYKYSVGKPYLLQKYYYTGQKEFWKLKAYKLGLN